MELKGWKMTFTEFNKKFEGNMTCATTYVEAYEMTENIHYELTGKRRYSEYNSFRKARYNYILKHKK